MQILFSIFQAEIVLINCELKLFFFCALNLLSYLLYKITPLIIKIECRTKFFRKTFILQPIFCFKVIRVFSNDLIKNPSAISILGPIRCVMLDAQYQ